MRNMSVRDDRTNINITEILLFRPYEGHFRSNVTVPVTSLCMIQFSKTILHFVRLYINYKMVKPETKNAC